MKVLAINASPRKGGNCHILLERALKGAKDSGCITETIALDVLDISPWREPRRNRETGESPIEDDMEAVLTKIKRADAIILASPIYFGSLSAQAKIMIDRCQVLWERKTFLKEPVRENTARAALICVEASNRKDFFENAKQIAKNFFAVIEAEYVDELFCTGLEKAKDILNHPEFLKKAYALGRNLTNLKGEFHAGRKTPRTT